MTKHERADESAQTGVLGPDGEVITLYDLPSSDTRRWVIRRKAQVVTAVRGALLTLEEACARYNLTTEEFDGWARAYDRDGLAGLRTTLRGPRSAVA